MSNSTRTIVSACAAVAATAITTFSLTTSSLGPDQISPGRTVADASRREASLGAIPGFGKNADAMRRDDTIALWEAYRREVLIIDCMRDAELDYAPTELATRGQRRQSAIHLGLPEPSAAAQTVPESRPDSDAYWMTLAGITAQEASEGRGDEVGGCIGTAWDALPGLWELKRTLSEAQADMFERVQEHPALELARAEFLTCTDQLGMAGLAGPEDVDELVASGGSVEQAMTALDTCMPAYERRQAVAVAAAELSFVATHPALEKQRVAYADADLQMRADSGFVEFVDTGRVNGDAS